LISRIEIWNEGDLIETKELGFMKKMTWRNTQTMSVEFQHQKNKSQHKISMRFYERIGFLGDIGTISIDLTPFGDLSGEKSIGVFAKGLDAHAFNSPDFSELDIWKNYSSFD